MGEHQSVLSECDLIRAFATQALPAVLQRPGEVALFRLNGESSLIKEATTPEEKRSALIVRIEELILQNPPRRDRRIT